MINYEDYKLRVVNASAIDLTLITFELLSANLNLAISNFDDATIFHKGIKDSKKFLRELTLSLNMEEKIAHDLYDLYGFVRRILINQEFTKNLNELKVAKEIIDNIYDGFNEIKSIDTTSLMENTDNVYAGLTYKNGKLSEYVEPSNKGFRA